MDQGDDNYGVEAEFEAHFHSKEKNINMRLANVGRGFKNSILVVVCHEPYSLGRSLAHKKAKERGQYSNSDKNVKIVNNFPAVVRGARSPYQTVAKVTTLK